MSIRFIIVYHDVWNHRRQMALFVALVSICMSESAYTSIANPQLWIETPCWEKDSPSGQ